MNKKKKSLIPGLAFVFSLAALLLSLFNGANVPEDQSHLIDDLYQENQQLRTRVEALEDKLEQLMTAVNLKAWTLDVEPWADSTGADVTLRATPSGYQSGVSATFLVMLKNEQIASIPCSWDGSEFTATVSLSALDGYSYYCLISSPSGDQQLALATPASPDGGIAVYLQSSLSAYCNLVVNDWVENPGSLVLTDAYAQVQLPQISAAGEVGMESAQLVLRHSGSETARVDLELNPSEVAGSYDLTISNLEIPMPKLEEEDDLELSLEVILSDGRRLTAFGATWYLDGSKLSSAVG